LGLSAFFELHGLETFKEKSALSIFEADRFTLIIAAVASRRPTYLSSEEWKTGPWAMTGSRKPPIHYMIDHVADMPELYLMYIDYLKTTDVATRESLASSLEMSMARVLSEIQDWYTQWVAENKPHTKDVTLSPEEQAKYGFSTKLWFDDMDHAMTYIHYNTGLIILLELWKTFRKSTRPPREDDDASNEPSSKSRGLGDENVADKSSKRTEGKGPLPDKGGSVNQNRHNDTAVEGNDNAEHGSPTTPSLDSQARTAALEICRVLPLYVSPSGALNSAIQLVVAVRMALIVCRQDPESSQLVAWLEQCIERMSESRGGWEIAKHTMQGFGYY
jgi:hypothetical protein